MLQLHDDVVKLYFVTIENNLAQRAEHSSMAMRQLNNVKLNMTASISFSNEKAEAGTKKGPVGYLVWDALSFSDKIFEILIFNV